jgi:hypothetical protein
VALEVVFLLHVPRQWYLLLVKSRLRDLPGTLHYKLHILSSMEVTHRKL